MRLGVSICLTILVLSGCDAATSEIARSDPTIVLPAGFQIEVAGRDIPVQGFDECPKQDGFMAKLMGSAHDETGRNCIVLDKNRTEVLVLVALPTGSVKESWSIVRDTVKTSGKSYPRTSLRRPDGSFVIPAASTRADKPASGIKNNQN